MSGITLIDAQVAGDDTSLAGLGTDSQLPLDGVAKSLASAPESAVIVAQGTGSASDPNSTLNEESRDDCQVAQAETALAEESPVVLPDSGVVAESSLSDLALDEGVSAAVATDITGSTPAPDGTGPASADPDQAAGAGFGNDPIMGVAFESQAVDALGTETEGGEPSAAAPAGAMAMSIDSGAALDGAMGASSLAYGDCWSDPVDGGEYKYYDDGTIEWYTRPYVIGDATGDVFFDILPLPVDDGVYVDGSGDWTDADEWQDWDYVEQGEDWVFVEEGEDWTYVDEGNDWIYVENGEDWVFVEEDEWLYEDEDWIYLDEWEDSGYSDGGEDWVYADGEVISDPEVIVCYLEPAGATLTVTMTPVDGDLFMAV